MMESCLAERPERVGPVEVDDIRRNLLSDFTSLPQQDEAQVQSENLKVFLRVRPFTSAESYSEDLQDCVTIEGPESVVLKAPRTSLAYRQTDRLPAQTSQRFTFTQVFGPEVSQRKVYEGSVRGLVQDVLEGGNCLVFTYGVTNAGKTFTFLGPENDSGLLPRAVWSIFSSVENRLYRRCDLKPLRCRDFSRLTAEQQAVEMNSKRSLLRTLKDSDKSMTSCRSTSLGVSYLSSDSEGDSFCLDVSSSIRFSIWVSFCEIYNDNIHDLLEQVPVGHLRRTVLRLSQDVKGNSFIKDLRWVEVSSSNEAYRLMKIGRRNQSLSSTRLNQQSSRSHSIFSIRVLRVEDSGVPRVLCVSELVLCDLAGSERCSRTHNTGERLKEAGNINNSLLTLGKCLHAMRLNQHAKFQHHIPFRESKLTHFLQFFFGGAGKVSMVVNISQSSSCVDETLNVLKFSALAQKVVVVNSLSLSQSDASRRSAMELSIIIDEADRRHKVSGRKSSMVAWETILEDVIEDKDGEESEEDEEEEEEEEEDEEEEESMMEGMAPEVGQEDQQDKPMEDNQLDRDTALRLVLEAQIREEVSTEFMELIQKIEKDYSERLEKERVILEERAEKRVEILKKLVTQTAPSTQDTKQEEQVGLLQGIISSMSKDLDMIREDAQSVHHCLTAHTHAAELEALRLENQQSLDHLQAANERMQQQEQSLSELQLMCQQKDQVITSLQESLDRTSEEANRDVKTRLHDLESQSEDGARSVWSLKQEVERQRREAKEGEEPGGAGRFHAAIEELAKESRAALEKSAQLSAALQEVQRQKNQLEEDLQHSLSRCQQLTQELANQREEHCQQLANQREEHCQQMHGLREHEEQRTEELRGRLCQKEKLLEASVHQLESMRRELEALQEALQTRTEEERKENVEEKVTSVVDELKEEMRRLQERKERREEEEVDLHVSPLMSNMVNRKTPKITMRKRKRCEMEVLVGAEEEKESDHLTVRCHHFLRAKTCRK